MKIDKISRILTVLGYLLKNPYCTAPEIRDFLGITNESPLSKEEKRLYAMLTKMEKEGYIFKIPIKRRGSGGPQFKIKLSEKGFGVLTQLKSYRILPERFPSKQHERLRVEDKEEALDRILKVYSGEIFDLILDGFEEILHDILKIRFENVPFRFQQEVIDIVNETVQKIRERTSEISQIFF